MVVVTVRSVLPRLTALRWYAAVFVFLYHAGTVELWRPLRIFNFGTLGVTFFFVLSGFVLAWSTAPDLAPRTFYRRRFARIYPSYLVMFGITAALVAVWADKGITTGWLGALTTLTMVQAWVPTGNYPVFSFDAPEWSLSCEAFFYAMFPFIGRGMRSLSPRRRDLALIGAFGLAIAASAVLTHFGHFSVAYTNPLIRLPEFAAGMWFAMKVQDGWRPRIPIWVAVALVCIAYEVARKVGTNVFSGHGDFVVVIPFGLLLAAAASTDLDGRSGILTRPVSIYLGEVSFAFYLVHVVVLSYVAKAAHWGHAWSGAAGAEPLAVTFVACLAAAILLHHAVELPMQRVLRGAGRGSIATADPKLVALADERP
jgi:peptidoglycan/LPS O-acetylase OafA/YrhL